MGKGKLWPSANPKPLNRSSPNLNVVITSWTPTTKKFELNPPRGFCSPYKWNIRSEIYTLLVRNLLYFFGSWTRRQESPLDRFFTLNTSNDAVLRKEVPFYCYKIKILFFTYLFEKFEKKLQWRLWGKFKNSLNCHNFGCVQDRVVIFSFRIWFSGTG